jgi:aryl-alcohol dehydrogenase-like predicted oxidoreductase
VGTGTWAWGDGLYWGYGGSYGESDVRGAFEASRGAGIDFFDTAEVYGLGKSERLLGAFVRAASRAGTPPSGEPRIATKFSPVPWRLTRGQVVRALRGSLARLGLPAVDLYQIHWYTPLVSIETLMDGMADAVERGLTRAVGVSNFNAARVRRAHARLAVRGIALASNQIQYNLLARAPDFDGTIQTCRERGVTVIAYSPLKYGVLTGKYDPAHPPPGARGRQFDGAYLARVAPLLQEVRQVAAEQGRTMAQVAVRWTIQRGTLPIPGAKNTAQARENAGALGWRLPPQEMDRLDRASDALFR